MFFRTAAAYKWLDSLSQTKVSYNDKEVGPISRFRNRLAINTGGANAFGEYTARVNAYNASLLPAESHPNTPGSQRGWQMLVTSRGGELDAINFGWAANLATVTYTGGYIKANPDLIFHVIGKKTDGTYFYEEVGRVDGDDANKNIGPAAGLASLIDEVDVEQWWLYMSTTQALVDDILADFGNIDTGKVHLLVKYQELKSLPA